MDLQNSFAAAKTDKFPTKLILVYPPHLKYVAALTSFINIKYGDVTIEVVPSRNEQHAVIRFLWAKRLTALTLQSGLGSQWLSSFWADEETARWAEIRISFRVLSVVRQWLGQPASFFASGIQKLVNRWDKCLNELGRYEKRNTNV